MMSMSKIALNIGRVTACRSLSSFRRFPTALSRCLIEKKPVPMIRSFSTAARTKGDEELSSFLAEEIEAEKKQAKTSLPKIAGFDTRTEGCEVYLTKKFNDETISIELNVNHSVDAEDNADMQQAGQNVAEIGEMLSKPNFDVIIEKGGKKLFFNCSFNMAGQEEGGAAAEDGLDESFSIVEFAMYEGEEMKENVYSVSGDIMDGVLYDLLMNMLEERGVCNEFAAQLVEFSTTYEHSQYIGLLEKLKNFVAK